MWRLAGPGDKLRAFIGPPVGPIAEPVGREWIMCIRIFSMLLAGLWLAGCSSTFTEAPVSTRFEASGQRKLQSMNHWQLIAEDAAGQLLRQLQGSLCVPGQPVCNRGLHEGKKLYIQPQAADSPFHRAFKTSLRNALIRANAFRITKNPGDLDVLVIQVETEHVRWASRVRGDSLRGEMRELDNGLWVLRNAGHADSARGGVERVSADAYFTARSVKSGGPPPRHELMVSVTVSDPQYYYANTTDVYYTTERDFHSLYAYRKLPPELPKLPSAKVRVTE